MIETTISGIIVFSGVITILVVILNYAQSKLLPQDEVSLIINDKEDEAINVSPGSTLLSALSGEKIFLPSACGGGGTCALCKCQVLDGGGDILPTETSHINRTEAKDNWRLSCQVKIKQDMKIRVPDEIFNIQKVELSSLRRQIGFVSQEPNLITGTVLENIIFNVYQRVVFEFRFFTNVNNILIKLN